MTKEYAGYLAHHGIKGQKWGVRRFQNEDGTLTPEGKQRYYDAFDKVEKEADDRIAINEKQIADVKENGWNAESAFSKKFVKDVKREGLLNDEYLDYIVKNVFVSDLELAKSNKKIAKEAKDFLSQNKDITLDEIYDHLGNADGQDLSGLTEAAAKTSKELGTELKVDYKATVEHPYDPEFGEELRKENTSKQITDQLEKMKKEFKKYGINTAKMSVNGKMFSSMSEEEQLYYLLYLIKNAWE